SDILKVAKMATGVSVGASANLPVKGNLGQDVAQDVRKVGVIGYGYWGPNVVRNFHAQEHSKVAAVCDKSPHSLRRVRQSHSDIHLTDNYEELLTAPDIDVIAVVTPVWTHFELAKAALLSGKH